MLSGTCLQAVDVTDVKFGGTRRAKAPDGALAGMKLSASRCPQIEARGKI